MDYLSQLFRVQNLLLFIFSSVLSLFFHEFGHFLCAVCHQITVKGAGFSLFLIFPSAFVDLCGLSLYRSRNIIKLQVYFAGIWHNLVLTVLFYFSLSITTLIWSRVSYTGFGVTVLYNSGRFTGIEAGDVLVGINECTFGSKSELLDCLTKPWPDSQGFCVPKITVDDYPHRLNSCGCSSFGKDLCFSTTMETAEKYYCLYPGKVIRNKATCTNHVDCEYDHWCLQTETDYSRGFLFEIKIKGRDSSFFVGDPFDVFKTIELSDFVGGGIVSPFFCYSVDFLFQSIFIVSLSLAFSNIFPFPYFDGISILTTIIDFFKYDW